MAQFVLVFCLIFLFSCSAKKQSFFQNHILSDSIVGGTEATSSDAISHFTVGLYDKKIRFICTGSLIRENVILTAAHCIESDASNIVIVFGLDFSAYDTNQIKSLRTATAVQIHPEFKKENASDLDWNDLALIRFSGGIPEGYIPVSLLKDSENLKAGAVVQMAGFGSTGVELQEVTAKKDKKFRQALDSGEIICYDKELTQCYRVTFLGTDRLRFTEAKIEGFTEKEIRLNEANGHGTCNGDSGGPLIYENALIGVTSRGSSFCDGPAVYTNAVEYTAWIENVARQWSP